MSVGANIRARRMALDMSQVELAEKVHVSQSMICQIERGAKAPSLPLGAEIAGVLKCPIESLLDGGTQN